MNQLNPTGIALVSYLLGILTGYYGCGFFKKILKINGEIDYQNLVILVVSIGWIVSVLFEILNPLFQTNYLMHGLMGAIVGYFFKRKKDE